MSMAKIKEVKAGKVDVADLRKALNSNLKGAVYDLREENPTDVKEWIPTGATWLDGIIAKGRMGGIPVGKIIEIAGIQATGKSYLAAQIAGNAQKQGIIPVYFDAESAINSDFLTKAGCDLENLIYIQPPDLESVFETMETLMGSSEQRFLFIIDSLAATPTKVDTEGTFNPNLQADAGGVFTQSVQYGQYVKIGKVVYINIHIVWTNYTGSGSVQLNGVVYGKRFRLKQKRL